MAREKANGLRDSKAWVVTGPTSGIGRRAALRLAKHGVVVLVGRDQGKLDAVTAQIADHGGSAVSVLCDFSDVASTRQAAEAIGRLGLPIAGVLNNAGMIAERTDKSPQGWDLIFATNHLGPFSFTEALAPHLADGTNIVFVCSAVEDPDRKPATMAGYRGGRFISAEASARGEWSPGGSTKGGYDAYATSKQCELATVFGFAREWPRLRVNAIEPGFNPSTGLVREAPAAARFVLKFVMAPLAPVMKYWSTPGHAARVITSVLTGDSTESGVYYDENGKPMTASVQVRDPAFVDRVVSETRALLATVEQTA